MLTAHQRRLRHAVLALTVLAGLTAALALLGNLVGQAAWYRLVPGQQGMSLLTSVAILSLSIATWALMDERQRLAQASGVLAGVIAIVVLASHAAFRADLLNPWLEGHLLGQQAPYSRTAIATALSILFVAGANLRRMSRPTWADPLAATALVITGTALLGYAYDAQSLYALPIFNTLALNTAACLFVLALAIMLALPTTGWVSIVSSPSLAERTTRWQLLFSLLLPVVGFFLVKLTDTSHFGLGAPMALMVVITIVPLEFLILRDGRAQIALDAEREAKAALTASVARDMKHQLAQQAEALEHAASERAAVEALMFRAQRMEVVGRLTGGIAHDFNNLLQAISGNVHLLRRRLPEGDPGRRFVEGAAAAVARGAKVTARLMSFSSTQRLSPHPVQVRAALQAAETALRRTLPPEVDLAVRLPGESVWVQADPEQLELALQNLCSNAVDAMPRGGKLQIGCGLVAAGRRVAGIAAADRQWASISVKDTGTGMSSEVLAKAVEPFFTTKDRDKATGLGLAQVYSFARQCGGDLVLASEPFFGTTAEIVLRQVDAPADRKLVSVDGPAWHRQGLVQDASQRRVLVIDDDEGVRSVTVQTLADAGFEVDEAADGQRGLRMIAERKPDLAVIDFIMPGIDGAEVARRARALHPDLPIVFVSGFADTVALDGIAGAVLLRKPFAADWLLSTVASAIAVERAARS